MSVIRTSLRFGTVLLLMQLWSCGLGVLSHSVTFKNPSFTYECLPIIDGVEQQTLATTSNRTFTVMPGEHTFNARFLSGGVVDQVGTPQTVMIDQEWEVACWQFMEDE